MNHQKQRIFSHRSSDSPYLSEESVFQELYHDNSDHSDYVQSHSSRYRHAPGHFRAYSEDLYRDETNEAADDDDNESTIHGHSHSSLSRHAPSDWRPYSQGRYRDEANEAADDDYNESTIPRSKHCFDQMNVALYSLRRRKLFYYSFYHSVVGHHKPETTFQKIKFGIIYGLSYLITPINFLAHVMWDVVRIAFHGAMGLCNLLGEKLVAYSKKSSSSHSERRYAMHQQASREYYSPETSTSAVSDFREVLGNILEQKTIRLPLQKTPESYASWVRRDFVNAILPHLNSRETFYLQKEGYLTGEQIISLLLRIDKYNVFSNSWSKAVLDVCGADTDEQRPSFETTGYDSGTPRSYKRY